MHRSDASLYVPKQDNFVLVMQDVMVTGLASVASVSRLRMAATFAIVRLDGMVQSAMYQVLLSRFSVLCNLCFRDKYSSISS